MKEILSYAILLIFTTGVFTHDGLGQTQPRTTLSKHKKYISLDMLDSLYEVKRYTFKTVELYGVDETIEVYNVKVGGLVFFSVMPDFTSTSNWTEIRFEDSKDAILNKQEVYRILESDFFRSLTSERKTMGFKLIKREYDKYWISNVCLTEVFSASPYQADVYPAVFNVPQGTINIMQTPISIVQMMDVFDKSSGLFEDWGFPLDFRKGGATILPNRHQLEREYLSKVLDIKGEPGYQFWTLTDWSSPLSYSYHRGVDRFIYMPDKGIVGGSYDFYFLAEIDTGWDFSGRLRELRPRHKKTDEELWQNVIEEKVMLAEELKNP